MTSLLIVFVSLSSRQKIPSSFPVRFLFAKAGAVFIGKKDDDGFDTERVLHLFLKIIFLEWI